MARRNLPLSGACTLAILGYCANALAVDCFIDSVGGNDSNTGLTEDQAVKSQAKIPKTCTVAKYRRGSQFAEKVAIGGSVKTYTNYGDPCDPLPKFVMPGTTNTGPVVSSYQGGITIDGLALANSHGDGSSSTSNFGQGVCVTLGGNSVMQNCDITSCDIGVMLSGTGSRFLNNYVHDLNTMIADADQSSGVNINLVGGAEAIFVNGSDNEVAYNQFINCTGKSEWTGGSCDGGATEVSIGNGKTLSGVKIHHNFAYNTCGFFEVSSGTQGGTFADSQFYNNVAVDSGWMFLLQVNNTKLSNIRWENNTIIYHKSADSSFAPTVSMIYDGTGTSGAGNAKMGTVDPDTVFFNNNLVLFDGFSSTSTLDKNISQSNNLITTTTAGVVRNIGRSGAQPSPIDFELVDGSAAINKGMAIASIKADFLNRAVPSDSAADIGAFEFGASQASGQSIPVSTLDVVTGTAGDCKSAGGATTGSSAATGNGGASNATSNPATGGKPSTPASSENASSTPASSSSDGGQASASTESSSKGGVTSADSSARSADGGDDSADSTEESPSQGAKTSASAPPTATSPTTAAGEIGGCNCRVVGRSSAPVGVGLFGLAALGLLARRRRRS